MTIQETFRDWQRVINLPLLMKTLNEIPADKICPNKEDVFKAFTLCPFGDCRVVFLGQDF